MDSDGPEKRPESPKKKIRPTSTSNFEPVYYDRSASTGSVIVPGNHCAEINGSAPTRRGRDNVGDSGSDSSSGSQQNIQEEVVSSSESSVCCQNRKSSYTEGNADSLTNESAEMNLHENTNVQPVYSLQDSEAESKEL